MISNPFKISVLLFFTCSILTVSAQEKLSLADAMGIALKNNYDIQVARNEAHISRINNTHGNAGMLPTVQLTGSANRALNNVNQQLSSGTSNIYPSQNATTFNAGAELSWTLFDGGKMFVTKSKLNEIQGLGDLQFKSKVLQTQADVIAAYYNVVSQKQQLNSINEVINYNRERVKIIQTGFDHGYYIKTDLLQAQIDLNVALENAINQKFAIQLALKNLNLLLAQPANVNFEVEDSIPLNYNPNRDELIKKLLTNNTDILSLQKQKDIASLVLKENESLYLPKINFIAGYFYNKNISSPGSILQNQSFGPELGGTLTIPLYSAGENKRKVAGAKIQLQSADLQLKNLQLQTNTALENALTDFENQRELLNIEKQNHQLTKQNLEISLNRLAQGQTTSLEVHQAQESYAQSVTRLINFEYNLKLAETNIRQLVAEI
jgi:outer membrane protein TolC